MRREPRPRRAAGAVARRLLRRRARARQLRRPAARLRRRGAGRARPRAAASSSRSTSSRPRRASSTTPICCRCCRAASSPASGLADGLVVRAVPFDLPRIEVGMLWHRRHERDPAQRWLRETVEEVVKGLGIGEPRGRAPTPRREAVVDRGLSARARSRENPRRTRRSRHGLVRGIRGRPASRSATSSCSPASAAIGRSRRCCCCTAIRRRTRCGTASRARWPPTSPRHSRPARLRRLDQAGAGGDARARSRAAQQAGDGRRPGRADALARPRALRAWSATIAAAASRTGSRSTIRSGSSGSP